ncbi:hypothetical protein VTG60DRAFT_6931 [Thermothelomyces hinnuleus]
MPVWRHFLMVHVQDKADELYSANLENEISILNVTFQSSSDLNTALRELSSLSIIISAGARPDSKVTLDYPHCNGHPASRSDRLQHCELISVPGHRLLYHLDQQRPLVSPEF